MLLFCTLCLSAFAGCGRRQFVKVDNPSDISDAATDMTEPQTDAAQNVFTFAANIQMGMSIAEVQAACGQVNEVSVGNDRKSTSNSFYGIFLNYATEKSVIFMFDVQTEKLEQLQFRGSTETDGLNTADAVALFDERYGKQAIYKGHYRNHVWKSDNVYIILSEVDIDNYAVTYNEETYFEQNYKEEADAYRSAR